MYQVVLVEMGLENLGSRGRAVLPKRRDERRLVPLIYHLNESTVGVAKGEKKKEKTRGEKRKRVWTNPGTVEGNK